MAPRKSSLRAVSADEKPPTVAPKTVTDAAAQGSTRELLVAMRDRVAKDVQNENTPSRDLAALTKRLMEIVRDIEAIDARTAEEARESAATADEAWDAEAL